MESVSAFAAYKANGTGKKKPKKDKSKTKEKQQQNPKGLDGASAKNKKKLKKQLKMEKKKAATAAKSKINNKKSEQEAANGVAAAVGAKKLTNGTAKKMETKINSKEKFQGYMMNDMDVSQTCHGNSTYEFSDLTINSSSATDSSDEGQYVQQVAAHILQHESTENQDETEMLNESGVVFSLSAIRKATAERKRRNAEAKAAANKNTNNVASGSSAAAKRSKAADSAATAKASKSLTAEKPTTSAAAAKRNSIDAAAEIKLEIKTEVQTPKASIIKMNSIEEGKKVFGWLIKPDVVDDFFSKYWEKSAFLIKRKQPKYYAHLLSFEAIDQMLLKHHLEFTKNVDITSYENGIRQTHNPEGRAIPSSVWAHYSDGCSIRFLNPQTFIPAMFTLNTTLQEYFHCMVGANVYITPPKSQGFAPHYDDIEAFVLQIEGRKRWKLYKPRNAAETLPRTSSVNFNQNEIGTKIFDEVLEPGDLLYFPRGTIHQACTEPGYHSLHITLSVYQKQSYADLFEKMMPLILQRAIKNNLDMRRGLPLHAFEHTGLAFSSNDTANRAKMLQKVTRLFGNCLSSVPLAEVMDSAMDQLAKRFQHEALPPEILPAERERTVFGSRSTTNARGECIYNYDIDLRTNVRLLRAHILRLVEEEGIYRIYFYLDNSKEYCEYERNYIEIEREVAGSIEVLIKSYPEYVGVSQLPLKDDERKIQVITALWERGLLMTEKPFATMI